MSDGLYLHIPFCQKRCDYCDFYTMAGRGDLFAPYTAALLHALDTAPLPRGSRVDTVYFGGGTPTMLGADRLCTVLEGIRQRYRSRPGRRDHPGGQPHRHHPQNGSRPPGRGASTASPWDCSRQARPSCGIWGAPIQRKRQRRRCASSGRRASGTSRWISCSACPTRRWRRCSAPSGSRRSWGRCIFRPICSSWRRALPMPPAIPSRTSMRRPSGRSTSPPLPSWNGWASISMRSPTLPARASRAATISDTGGVRSISASAGGGVLSGGTAVCLSPGHRCLYCSGKPLVAL